MVFERAGIQVMTGHITVIEGTGCLYVLAVKDHTSARVECSPEEARHLASRLRRIANRVDSQR